MEKPTAKIKQKTLPSVPYPKTPVIRPKPREPEGLPVRVVGNAESRTVISKERTFEEKILIRMYTEGDSYQEMQERFGLSHEALCSWIGRLRKLGKLPKNRRLRRKKNE